MRFVRYLAILQSGIAALRDRDAFVDVANHDAAHKVPKPVVLHLDPRLEAVGKRATLHRGVGFGKDQHTRMGIFADCTALETRGGLLGHDHALFFGAVDLTPLQRRV